MNDFFLKYFSNRINVSFVCRRLSVAVVQTTPSFVFQIKDNARNSGRVRVRVDYKVLISICWRNKKKDRNKSFKASPDSPFPFNLIIPKDSITLFVTGCSPHPSILWRRRQRLVVYLLYLCFPVRRGMRDTYMASHSSASFNSILLWISKWDYYICSGS